MIKDTQRTIVMEKDWRHRRRICTLHGVIYPVKFMLDTCDGITTTITNTEGELIAVLTRESPVHTVTKNGYYEICMIGEGDGVVYSSPYVENEPCP